MTQSIEEARSISRAVRKQGKKIACVPTMGCLHEGHLSLVRKAEEIGDFSVVTIFVNPTQFGPGEDLSNYPRNLARDRELLDGLGVDLLFCPSECGLYPANYETFVSVQEISKGLCGAYRPSHFQGVATILTKLFHILQPQVAIFGEKDFQQLVLVKRMVQDLNFDIEIVGLPTVREADGLALSSRNLRLSQDERKAAVVLRRSLEGAERMIAGGETQAQRVIEAMRYEIGQEPLARLEYASICDPETLESVSQLQGGVLIALAVWIGRTRLIDNSIVIVPGAKESDERMSNETADAQG